jgi:hypothetical protein
MSSDYSGESAATGPRIMIVGGYGVVGRQIATLVTKRIPGSHLIIAGRSLQSAQQFAATLPHGEGVAFDVSHQDPFSGMAHMPDVVVAAVNDPQDNVLKEAIRRGLSYVDVTRWTAALESAVLTATSMQPSAPVLFSSSWMAGIPALLASSLSRRFTSVESIDMSILFALADKAGPDSVAFAAQMGIPAKTWVNGSWTLRPQMREKKSVLFGDGVSANVRSFSTPDLRTLPGVTGAQTVKVNIGYDDPMASGFLAGLVQIGLWRATSGPAFDGLRKSILYHPGAGAPHRVRIDVSGRDSSGKYETLIGQIVDPKGQTHLTALGAVLGVERIVGRNGANAVQVGVSFSDNADNPAALLDSLHQEGVMISTFSS